MICDTCQLVSSGLELPHVRGSGCQFVAGLAEDVSGEIQLSSVDQKVKVQLTTQFRPRARLWGKRETFEIRVYQAGPLKCLVQRGELNQHRRTSLPVVCEIAAEPLQRCRRQCVLDMQRLNPVEKIQSHPTCIEPVIGPLPVASREPRQTLSRHLRRIVEGGNHRLDHLLICASAPFHNYLRLINLLSGCRRRVRQGCPPLASDEESGRSTKSPRRSACLSKQACRKAPGRCRSPTSIAHRCSPVLALKPATGWAETCGLRTGCR